MTIRNWYRDNLVVMDIQIPIYSLSLWERVRVRVDKPSIQRC